MKEEPVGCEKESLMIIKVVSKVLDHLIAGAKAPPSNLGLFVKFQSSYAPEVSVQSYLERIRKYSRCSDACFVMALIYIDRLIECRQLMLTQLNVHRLLVTCVMVAAKFHDDLFYNNSYYAKLGGLPLPELNLLEIDLLKLMNFTLFIDKDAYANYFQELKKYFFGLDQVPSPVSVATAGSNVNASFHAAPAAPMAAVGGGGLVKSSVSCPNFANVVASASSGVEDYRVPTPRNPHDKAGSVNVSNEYYFGGYASALSNTTVQDLHSSSESPEFVDGNPYVDYDSPYRAYGDVSYTGEGSEEYPVADHFAQKGHQHSCDNVANVMPLYLSPQPGCAPVRQLDRQTSSWHRSAALMVHEDCGGEGLSLDTSSCEYDEHVYSVYHQQQVDLLAAARRQHLQLQQQQQQMLARHRAAYGYGVEPTVGGGGYYTNGSAAPYGQSVSGHWMNHHHHHHQQQQQQHLYSRQSQGYEGAGAGYVDMPNVVDIHGHYHGSFAMHTAAAASAPYVTVGGPGGRYHTYQRQHSA